MAIKQMCQVSLKYMEPNNRSNDLKIASFWFSSECRFLKFKGIFLARHHSSNLNFALNYKQLKIHSFCPQNDLLPVK